MTIRRFSPKQYIDIGTLCGQGPSSEWASSSLEFPPLWGSLMFLQNQIAVKRSCT
jgi:hypothetical protein